MDEREIKEKMKEYLINDRIGLRKAILEFFLHEKSCTTEDVYRSIREGFDVSHKSISAIVGLINPRLGILNVDVRGNRNIYSLKKPYRNLIKAILENY
jgi:hypothetical protein